MLVKVDAPPRLRRSTAAQVGGLAEIKAGRIQQILDTLQAERGECTLERLRGCSAAEVKAELGRFKVTPLLR